MGITFKEAAGLALIAVAIGSMSALTIYVGPGDQKEITKQLELKLKIEQEKTKQIQAQASKLERQ